MRQLTYSQEEQLKVKNLAAINGYRIEHSGGCTALWKDLPDGGYIMITNDAALPETLEDPCTACYYPPNDDGNNWTMISDTRNLDDTIKKCSRWTATLQADSGLKIVQTPAYQLGADTIPMGSPVGIKIGQLLMAADNMREQLDPAHHDALTKLVNDQANTLYRG